MANIVIFCNESMKNPDAGYTPKWNTELAKAFEELGNKVFWVNFSEEGVTNSIVEAFKEKPDFAFAFNWVYANVLNLKLNDGENLINKLNIPFVSWFWDGICVPTNPAVRFAGLNHLIVACVSEDETEEVTMLAPHVRQTFFNPLGGTVIGISKGGGIIPINKRKYHISYIGSRLNFYVDRNFINLPREIAQIINDIIDVMIADPLTPAMTALRQVLKVKNISVPDNWLRNFCFKYLNIANLYMRDWSRLKVIRTLANAGINIDIWGGGHATPKPSWEDEKWVTCHGGCSYGDGLQIMANSQITLNVGMFPGGLHDRVTSGMLNGAVVLTDPSTYYHKNFVDGEDSLTFDWKHLDELPEKVIKLLVDEDRMQRVADLGRKKALENHTWTSRAKKIIEQVQIYKAVAGI